MTRKEHSRNENARNVACASKWERPADRALNRRPLPARILSGTRDVSDPLWNAPGVNLRGQVGGRSRLAVGTIGRVRAAKCAALLWHIHACADGRNALDGQRLAGVGVCVDFPVVRFRNASVTARVGVTLPPWVNVTLNVTLRVSAQLQATKGEERRATEK